MGALEPTDTLYGNTSEAPFTSHVTCLPSGAHARNPEMSLATPDTRNRRRGSLKAA